MKQISLIFFLLLAVSLWGEEYFASNRAGMLFEKITRYRTDEFDWHVRVERSGTSVIRTLCDRKGNEVSIRETRYGSGGILLKETVTEGDSVTESVYDGIRLLEETFSEKGIVSGKNIYIYDGDFLKETVACDGDGNRLGSTLISRDGSGRITGAHFKGEGEPEDSGYVFSGGRLVMEWHGTDEGEGMSVRYGRDGRIVSRTGWAEGKKKSTEKFLYGENGLEATVLTYPENGRSIVRSYDGKGQLLTEEETEGDALKKKLHRVYEDSVLVSETVAAGGQLEKSTFEYENGKLAGETVYRNGRLYKIIKYRNSEDYAEEIYSGNELLTVHYYLDMERVSKEEWENAASDG